jgi:hypothetical protein
MTRPLLSPQDSGRRVKLTKPSGDIFSGVLDFDAIDDTVVFYVRVDGGEMEKRVFGWKDTWVFE